MLYVTVLRVFARNTCNTGVRYQNRVYGKKGSNTLAGYGD
jgi:hypothetical protein